MALKTTAICFFFAYLLISIDPIQASRIKATHKAVNKVATQAQETQELVREMQKALQENHMEELFIQNASSLYIGETWATCADRKADFERRSEKLKARYDEAQADNSLTTTEAGWVILKARSLAMTISTAKKQGCEWVENSTAVNMTVLGELMNSTAKDVPCRDQAVAALEKTGGDPQISDVANAMSMLFSEDCQPRAAEPSAAGVGELFAEEEKNEKDADELAAQFVAKQGGGGKQNGAEAVTSLMQRASAMTSSNIVLTLSGILSLIVSIIVATLVCFVALIVWALLLGLIWCIFRAVLSILLGLLGSHALHDDFGHCADRWMGWLKKEDTRNGLSSLGAAVCLLTTIIGTPIAGISGGGLWFNIR
jgi:hypothetical protein